MQPQLPEHGSTGGIDPPEVLELSEALELEHGSGEHFPPQQ
jgi:hypothetical protein